MAELRQHLLGAAATLVRDTSPKGPFLIFASGPAGHRREVVNGVLWVLRTGAPWADLPRRYPRYQTGHRRFQKWVENGTLHRALRRLAEVLKNRGKLDLS